MKDLLIDVLRFWERKLADGECTPEEIRKCYTIVNDNIDVLVSAKDIAEVYRKPLYSVKACISRAGLPEKNPPKVRKFYSLAAFRKIMPKSWTAGVGDPTPPPPENNRL